MKYFSSQDFTILKPQNLPIGELHAIQKRRSPEARFLLYSTVCSVYLFFSSPVARSWSGISGSACSRKKPSCRPINSDPSYELKSTFFVGQLEIQFGPAGWLTAAKKKSYSNNILFEQLGIFFTGVSSVAPLFFCFNPANPFRSSCLNWRRFWWCTS